jgi:hypothetical protein
MVPTVAYLWPDDDGFGDSRGWDRASIAFNTRHEYRPKIGQEDLLLPGSGRTFLLCWITGVCLTLLWVGVPLFVLNIFLPSLAGWFGIVFAAAFFGFPVALFAVSKHEDKGLRKLAREL